MNRFQFPGALALCISATLVAQKPTAVDASIKADGTVKVTDGANRTAPVMPLGESVYLSPKPDGAAGWAECQDAWSGTRPIKGKKILCVAGKSKKDNETPDLVGVDLNGDGKLSKDEQMTIDVTITEAKGNQPARKNSKPVDATLEIDGMKFPAKVSWSQVGDQAPAVRINYSPSYLQATVKIGDKDRVVAVLDKDLDGKFGTAGDLWVVGDAGRGTTVFALSAMKERRFDNGNLVGVTVTGNSIDVTAAPGTAQDPADAAAHRVRAEHQWTEVWDADRDVFAKGKSLDTTRPKATTPIKWNYVTFDEGLAMAKKANKPLFVDVLAFWCPWCYRLDETTYSDKQVADLLTSSYVPVKIIEEQNLVNDGKRLQAMFKEHDPEHMRGGIPAMGVCTTEGKVVHTIGGWKKPEEFLKDLETGLKAASGGDAAAPKK